MPPAPSDYNAILERIKSARAALHAETNPDKRDRILDELGVATRKLAEFIVEKKGRLKSPLE